MLPHESPSPALSHGADADGRRLLGADDDFGFGAIGDGDAKASAALAAGTRLEGVTLVRLIAEGGMGQVYEARQHAPARPVAVKVLRHALVSPVLVRRFHHEVALLARLSHPGIAQVHAAGIHATRAGELPYFVMEFVADAATITDFAKAKAHSTRERVVLVAKVAAAVAHAHREGVVHRDLKPGNILVDATGAPKVIDFGVARAIDTVDDRITTATGIGQLLGTVRYMAPEQLGLEHGEADARSDVYALGLVLHEMVFDDLPYEIGNRSVLEAASVLSKRTSGEAGLLTRRLRERGVRRDDAAPLAAIMATCLEPRPSDRYRSGRELAADLDRWLAGDTVQARPSALVESVVRLARRHRVAAAVTAAGIAVLVAMLGVVFWAWRDADHQRQLAVEASADAEKARAAAERSRAETEARAAEVRRQLYYSTVQLAAEARDRDNLGEAHRLLDEARTLASGVTANPVELGLLAASLDDSIAIFDLAAGTVTAVDVSTDGARIAVATDSGHAACWTRGRPPLRLPSQDVRIWAIGFSRDGSVIATGASDGRVRVFAGATGDTVATVDAHDGPIYGLDYSPDGTVIATAGRDRVIRLWNPNSWRCEGELPGHEGTVLSAVFAPDGIRLLTTASDGTARLWDVAKRRELLKVSVDSGRLFRGAFDSDGSRFATAGEDGHARVWDATTGTLLGAYAHPQRVNAVAFGADGDALATASGDSVLRVWDLATSTLSMRRRGHAGGIWSLASPSGQPQIVTGSADGTVRVWDLGPEGEPIVPLEHRGISVASSAAAELLAVGTAAGDVRLVERRTFRERRRLTGLTDRVNGLDFSPDGSMLAAADDAGTIHRWRLPDGEPFALPLVLHVRRAFDVSFAPDGKTLATAGEDRTARIVDALTGEDRVPPLRHPARVFCATFHPHGHWLATACEDRQVRLWDVATGRALTAWPGHERPVNWVAFSMDGKRLASASSDGTVRVWDVTTAEPRTPVVLNGPTGQVWKVAFSPDGSRIAATGADGLVQLWDTETGRPVTVLRGHTDATWGLTFLNDGRALATTSWDGTLRLWGVPMATLAAARHAVGE
jgi:WD40 repeat protein